MNPLLIFSVVPLAVLGAALIALGSFGWGILFWVLAMALSQTNFLADVWAEYKAQDPGRRALYAALVACLRRSA
jgi:hypothetical protein